MTPEQLSQHPINSILDNPDDFTNDNMTGELYLSSDTFGETEDALSFAFGPAVKNPGEDERYLADCDSCYDWFRKAMKPFMEREGVYIEVGVCENMHMIEGPKDFTFEAHQQLWDKLRLEILRVVPEGIKVLEVDCKDTYELVKGIDLDSSIGLEE